MNKRQIVEQIAEHKKRVVKFKKRLEQEVETIERIEQRLLKKQATGIETDRNRKVEQMAEIKKRVCEKFEKRIEKEKAAIERIKRIVQGEKWFLETTKQLKESKTYDKKRFLEKKRQLGELNADYIASFVRKYGLGYKSAIQEMREFFDQCSYQELKEYLKGSGPGGLRDFAREHFLDSSSPFQKLKELLARKGLEFDSVELDKLITEEDGRQNYQTFKQKVLNAQPKSVEEYIRNFLILYEGQESLYLSLLKSLLSEQGINFNNKIVEEEVVRIKNEMALERFENGLTRESKGLSSKENIEIMSGYEFENFLGKLFEKMGYHVKVTSLSGDQGADLIIQKPGEKIAVQAKRHEAKVSNRAVQEITAAVKHYDCDKGMIVTNAIFTTSAKELARSNRIELVNGTELKRWTKMYLGQESGKDKTES